MFRVHHWSTLSGDPTLLNYQGRPLVVFPGQQDTKTNNPLSQGCIVGAIEKASGWSIQPWSLSHECTGANAGYGEGEAENAKGQLSAAWPSAGNFALQYHVGVSPKIPATSIDRSITLPNGSVVLASEASDSHGNDHFYAAWYREFSHQSSGDGLYLADLSAGSAPRKAPGSGTTMVQNQSQTAAIANSGAHTGIYVAYCSNTSACTKLNLWHYGASKALAVPGSSGATVMALTPGPTGRLWVAWYNRSTNRIYSVRTNKADNYFGPVVSYKAQGCANDNNARIALGGGSSQRLDVVVVCEDVSFTNINVRVTQSLTGLGLRASTGSINNKKASSVRYRVTDASDPVAGATVSGDGHTGKTNASGYVTFKFSKGTRKGRFQITATLSNYLRATTSLYVR
jgi:hypothetical protein